MAITETRLIHEVHRRATTLLTEAAKRPAVPARALAGLREFLVKNLHHHHQTEDDQLWPMIEAAAPIGEDDDRAELARSADAVRDLVHRHLDDEEPVLFPALREHITPEQWTEFSVVASSPQEAGHLMVGFLDQIGTPEEVALVLSGLPEPAQQFVPMMRDQARTDLAVLTG